MLTCLTSRSYVEETKKIFIYSNVYRPFLSNLYVSCIMILWKPTCHSWVNVITEKASVTGGCYFDNFRYSQLLKISPIRWHFRFSHIVAYGVNVIQLYLRLGTNWIPSIPDNKVHGANMGPTWVLSAPDGRMLAPWTLLSGIFLQRCAVNPFNHLTWHLVMVSGLLAG